MVRFHAMPAVTAAASTISPEFVARLAERALDAERPPATIDDLIASRFTELLVPARYGGMQADFPAILDPVRRMAHGCASSAWTIGFYALHNWMWRSSTSARWRMRSRRGPSSRLLPWRRRAGACRQARASG